MAFLMLPEPAHIPVAVCIFIGTLLLIFRRPYNLNEAWFAVAGGLAMLGLGLETPDQAVKAVAQGRDVLLFLLALMVFSSLLDRASFFDWSALVAARIAKGDGKRLYRNIFILGALVTAFLSLDTTAIILTPIVVSLVKHLRLKSHPFLIACAFVANTGSLLLPVSNLTNLLFQSAFHYDFTLFALHMMLPQIVAVLTCLLILSHVFRKDIPESFDASELLAPHAVIKDEVFFRASIATFALVVVGYTLGSLAHLQPFLIAIGGCLALGAFALWRRKLDAGIIKDIAWSLFPFVAGLFVLIQGMENLGFDRWATAAIRSLPNAELVRILALSFGAAVGSNIVNNIPMTLLSITILNHAGITQLSDQYAALLGCNLGPNLTVAGSLATMLVISTARKRGEDMSAFEFFRIGAIITPVLLIVTSLALYAALKVVP